MDIGMKLKNRRKELKLTMLEVSQSVGVTEATVSRWESGDIAHMKRDKIVALAKALKVTPAFIMDAEDYTPTITEEFTTFPVIGDIAAGYDKIALEEWEGDTIEIPHSYLKGRSRDEFFVLRVKGDSMFPTYQDGDKLLVLKQDTLNYSGQVGVVVYDDECSTLKRVEFKHGEDWLRLVPINPLYPPELIEGERLEHCRILGIPRLLIRDVAEK